MLLLEKRSEQGRLLADVPDPVDRVNNLATSIAAVVRGDGDLWLVADLIDRYVAAVRHVPDGVVREALRRVHDEAKRAWDRAENLAAACRQLGWSGPLDDQYRHQAMRHLYLKLQERLLEERLRGAA